MLFQCQYRSTHCNCIIIWRVVCSSVALAKRRGISEKMCIHCSYLKLCRHNQVAFKLDCFSSQLTLKFLKSITSIDSVIPRRAVCAGLFRHIKERRVKEKCSVLSSKISSPATDKRVKNWVQGPVFLG